MKSQIDIKSALLGILLGVLAVFAIGAGASDNPTNKYQIIGIGNGTGGWAAIMVDTQTGKAWGTDIQKDWKHGDFWDLK